ncbi:MAG: MFS transporter [Candidatus Diapherotrites archaeon]
MSEKLKKNVLVLGLVSLLTDISSEMIFSILPVFMSSVLMLDKAVIGLIEGIAESSASVFKLLSAKAEKFLGKKKTVILFGYGLSTVVKPLFAFATNWWQLLLFRFGDRAGKGLRGPARDSIIADSSAQQTRGFSFGFHRTMDTIGAIIGPLLAFLILSLLSQNFRLVFLLSFIPAFLAVLIILFFVKEEKNPVKDNIKEKTLQNTEYKWFLLSASVFALGNLSFAFLLIRIQDLGLPVAFIPLAYLFFNISYAFFAIPFGKLADKIGRIKALALSFALFSLTFTGFALAKEAWIAIILLAVYGIATAGTETVQRTIASEIVPKQKRTGSLGTYQGITGLLLLPASIIAGILWSLAGAETAFAFSAITSISALAPLYKIQKNFLKPQRRTTKKEKKV